MRRRWYRAAAALAVGPLLLCTLIVASPHTTTAAYTDTASAETSPTTAPLTTQTTRLRPTTTHLGNTATGLQDDGTLWVWGFRGNGLAGNGTATVPSSDPPTAVALPNDGHTGSGRRTIVKVAGTSLDGADATNSDFTGLAALSDDGIVYTWGGTQVQNLMGRTAAPIPFTQPGPVSIPGTVVDLVSSATVFMALTSTGDVYTWGFAQGRGVTGQGTATASSATPTLILSGAHSIGAGLWNGWAIRGNDTPGDTTRGVFWWGWANGLNVNAGDPSGDDLAVSRFVPTRSTTLSSYATSGCDTVGVVMNSAADTCAVRWLSGHAYGNQLVTSAGTLFGWGNGANFGTGTGTQTNVPTVAPIFSGDTVVAVTVTTDYVEVLGQQWMYVYGYFFFAGGPDLDGGINTSSSSNNLLPMLFLGGAPAAIGGFGYSGSALLADGTFVSWGGSTAGSQDNAYSSIRNGWGVNTAPTNALQPATDMIPPGV